MGKWPRDERSKVTVDGNVVARARRNEPHSGAVANPMAPDAPRVILEDPDQARHLTEAPVIARFNAAHDALRLTDGRFDPRWLGSSPGAVEALNAPMRAPTRSP